MVQWNVLKANWIALFVAVVCAGACSYADRSVGGNRAALVVDAGARDAGPALALRTLRDWPRNHGAFAVLPASPAQAVRDRVLQARAARVDSHADAIQEAFARLPEVQRRERVDIVFHRIIGEDEVLALDGSYLPSDAEEDERVARILREEGVR